MAKAKKTTVADEATKEAAKRQTNAAKPNENEETVTSQQRAEQQTQEEAEQTSESIPAPEQAHQQSEINANQAINLKLQGDDIVNKYSVWGAGAGLVPLPAWDLVAIGTVQVMMLKELYALHGVSFSEKKARTTIHLLLAGLSPRLLAGVTVSSLLKVIPALGTALASVTLPILSSAATYATGKLMVSHLGAGGCLDDFDIEANKAKFSEEVESAVEKGKNVAQNVKQTVKQKTETA
jgi:uncharacterized protein (DUF697 family)